MVVMNDGNLHFLHYFLMRIGHLEGKTHIPHESHIKYEDLEESHHHHFHRKRHKINELFNL